MFKKLIPFVAVFLAILAISFTATAQVQGPRSWKTPADVPSGKQTIDRVVWKNAASADTTIRVFTVAAATYDTSRSLVFVAGADSVTLFTLLDFKNDTCQVKMFLDWGLGDEDSSFITSTRSVGTSATATVAFDSIRGAVMDTVATTTFLPIEKSIQPPQWARFARVRVLKHVSAATDSTYVKAYVITTWLKRGSMTKP